MHQSIMIQDVPCSPHRWDGKPWIKKDERKKWYLRLLAGFGVGSSKDLEIPKKITIHQWRTVLLDDDNVPWSCKLIIDCFKEWIERPKNYKTGRRTFGKQGLRHLKDDSPKFCRSVCTQEKVKKRVEERTEISLEWLE